MWGVMGTPVLVRGESGSGKTIASNAVVKLLYGDEGLHAKNPDLFLINETSNKAFLDHDAEEEIKRAKRCYIPELQNVKNIEALIKLWTEGRPKIYGRSIRGDYTDKLILEPLPILTNLADANEEMPELSNEMQRRIITLPTKSGAALNEKVHISKADMRQKTNEELKTLTEEEETVLREHLLACMDTTKRVLNPCAHTIRKVIPHKYTRSNTFIGYFLDVVEAITRFYQKDRVTTDEYIFATPTDNYVAWLLAGDIFRDMAIGIPNLGKEVLNGLPVHEHAYGDLEAQDVREARVHIDQIVDDLDTLGYPRPKKIVDDLMKRLVSSGFARVDKEGFYYRTKALDEGYKPDVNDLFKEAENYMSEKWKHLYSEYSGNRAFEVYIDPLSGNECNLLSATPKKEKKEKDTIDTSAIVSKEKEEKEGPAILSTDVAEVYEFTPQMLTPPGEFRGAKGKSLKRLGEN
jgi:ABC-type dipeptide/oligopeptide/nickel transport system ATPase component